MEDKTSIVAMEMKKCGGQESCPRGKTSQSWWSMNMGTGGDILVDQDNDQVPYLQKRANNDSVSRHRGRRPGFGGEGS